MRIEGPARSDVAQCCQNQPGKVIQNHVIVPQPRTSINVTAPSEGTDVKKGKKFDITWSIDGSVNRVDVMISRDGGSTWASLADNLSANTGSLRVKAKKPKSDAVIVRVTDSSNQATFGDSGTFRIR